MSEKLRIRGANTHNLKNISIDIPKNKLVVVTGVSGSGKSSLAFDTIYSEGQRRYLESLSTYARMIIGSINEDTKVEEITGLSPTISINQKTVSVNPRSTVGTITEIYDYYRLLYTHVGVRKCPDHPDVILKKDTLQDIISHIQAFPEDAKYYILAPIKKIYDNGAELRKDIVEMGFIRYMIDGIIHSVGDEEIGEPTKESEIHIVIDRLVKHGDAMKTDSDERRIKESLETAYKMGSGILAIRNLDTKSTDLFSQDAFCPLCHYKLEEVSLSNFSFNSHFGACEKCHGLGMRVAFLEENIINPRLSLNEGAILPWNQHKYYITILNAVCKKYGIDMNKPYEELSREAKRIVLNGAQNESFDILYTFDDGHRKLFKTRYEGVITNLERKYLEMDVQNETSLRRIAQYSTEIVCEECMGHRLKRQFLNIFVNGLNIGELSDLNIRQSIAFFKDLKLSPGQRSVAKNVLKNIVERLEFLSGVGLDYITVSRKANTLSGGESQRIRLATQIGTRLEGIIYILDEPSIGLHPKDNNMLIKNLKKLSQIGNSVIVVEHDEDIMRESDHIIDIGPGAGIHGGHVVFEGTFKQIIDDPESETGAYLSNRKRVHIERRDRRPTGYLSIEGARENNLRDLNVRIPLGLFNVVTGVSGSGKSSLVLDILSNHLLNTFHSSIHRVGKVKGIRGAEYLDKVIIMDQSPIGRTPHSNVATYTGVFTHIRETFSTSHEAVKRGYGPGRFSFNTRGGRCEICEGSGVKRVEMHFLPDVYVQCENCHGLRYNHETLEVRFKGKNISEVLDMDVEESLDFFSAHPKIVKFLKVLSGVGLGYIKIGQSATTLSGGESQRIKLASELAKKSTTKTIYILDEPTTGLHFSDVQKLLDILDSLVEKGNTVLVIEHNLDVIANADHVIDIGPEGGDAGGELIYTGSPEGIVGCDGSHTGAALKRYLEQKNLLAPDTLGAESDHGPE